jgi:hypothetical protein
MGFQLIFAICSMREPEGDALGKSEAEHGDAYYRSETRPLTASQKLIRAHA